MNNIESSYSSVAEREFYELDVVSSILTGNNKNELIIYKYMVYIIIMTTIYDINV